MLQNFFNYFSTENKMKNTKKTALSKSNKKNFRNGGKIDTPNTEIKCSNMSCYHFGSIEFVCNILLNTNLTLSSVLRLCP